MSAKQESTSNWPGLKDDSYNTLLPEFTTDVLIVGAGVTGLTLSALLSGLGIRTIAIAKHTGTALSPRAHVTNQRTVEIFRDMGIEDRVLEIATTLKDIGHGILATSLAGMEIARYSCYGSGARQHTDFALASPCDMINVPQNQLEMVLLAAAREKGADVRWYTELVHIEQSPDGVVARVRERRTGAEYRISARYAVGADGAHSLVAQQLGFDFQGEPGLMSMVSAWIDADLTKYTAHRPSTIYWTIQPGNTFWVGSGTWVYVHAFKQWVFNWQYDPADGEPDLSDAQVIARARSTIGDETVPIHVKSASKWQVNNVVAKTYCRGRVFLAGDAAHRHPPSSGLGSNTSIQDAYNLAWKLALVLSGRAGEALLDSYHVERQPVGQGAVDHAIQTLHYMGRIPGVLGLRRDQTHEEGWAALRDLFSDTPGAVQRREALAEVVHLQNYRSNGLGIMLGQRYTSSAVVDDGTAYPKSQRDPLLFYEATTHPGAYIPHAWVEYEGRRLSTIDIVGYGGFSLIVGIGGRDWVAAAKAMQEMGIAVSVYTVGLRCQYDDVLGEWAARREISDHGALLVRPDRHIAWRCADLPEDPTKALGSALRHILVLDPPSGSKAEISL